jgi:hypothetical protein
MSGRNKVAIWAAASAGLMVVGALGPWVKAFGFVSVSGTDGDGVIVLIAGLFVGGAVLLQRERTRIWVAAIGILAALLGATTAIYDIANIKSVAGNAAATVGWGLWLDVLASISAVVALLVFAWAGRAEKVAPTLYKATPVDGELVRN